MADIQRVLHKANLQDQQTKYLKIMDNKFEDSMIEVFVFNFVHTTETLILAVIENWMFENL